MTGLVLFTVLLLVILYEVVSRIKYQKGRRERKMMENRLKENEVSESKE